MTQSKKILVTGGAGFIGSHVVDLMISGGHTVHVADDLSSGSRSNLNPSAKFHQVDIRSPEMVALLKEIKPEVIVHTAAQISVRASMENPRLDTSINVQGLINILSEFRGEGSGTGKSPFFVLISTGGAIYGEQDVFPAPESHVVQPSSIYGLAKRVSELYLDLWSRQFGLKYCALRLSNVYGPRQNPHGEAGVIAIFMEKLLKGETPSISGTGKQTRDFVYVGDVAKAVEASVRLNLNGIFNIGTGVETTIVDLYSAVCQALGVNAPAIHGPARAGEQLRSSIDASLAAKSLSWRPSVAISEGLSQTAAWFKTKL